MIAYVTVGSNQLEKAKAYYDALLGSIGVSTLMEHGSGGRIYGKPGSTLFAVVGPYDGNAASVGNGVMVAFSLASREAVDDFYAKALELGGTDEGPPGPRGPEGSQAYMAYFRDLDGNKMSAAKIG